MPRLICRFRSKYPHVAIELHELNPAGQLTAFENNKIHIAFNRPLADVDKDHFHSVELFKEKLMVAVQGPHKLAKLTKVSIKNVGEGKFSFSSNVSRLQAYSIWQLGFCTDYGVAPKIVASPNMMSTALTFIASGVGIGLLPESVQNLNNSGVVFIETEQTSPPVPLELQWLKANSSPTVTAFVDMVEDRQNTIRETFMSNLK